jgi:rhamnosyltransferase subunit B
MVDTRVLPGGVVCRHRVQGLAEKRRLRPRAPSRPRPFWISNGSAVHPFGESRHCRKLLRLKKKTIPAATQAPFPGLTAAKAGQAKQAPRLRTVHSKIIVARILLSTFGSYGDLHPYMALGLELRGRGHQVTLATSAIYADKVRSEGLEFVAVRPDLLPADSATMARAMDARRGPEFVLRFLADAVRETYRDILEPVKRADLVVTHPIPFGTALAAQKLGVPWVSAVLAPFSFFSVYDPPVPAAAPWMARLRVLGPGAMRWMAAMGKRYCLPWVQPVLDLRRQLGLDEGGHPLFEGQHAPRLVLALFARCMAKRQPDWPGQTVVTGFPFYDRHHEQQGMAPELEQFLADGAAPLVFSLGSSAVGAAGDFYIASLEAARRLGMRAVFLTGRYAQGLPRDAMAVEYAPHSDLFPRAAAIVHHGGIGTTAQAMRSGRPMLVTPFAWDQFDNGKCVRRLGMAEMLNHKRYNARRAERLLRRLVEDPRYAQAGAAVAAQVRAENGVKVAADAICGELGV